MHTSTCSWRANGVRVHLHMYMYMEGGGMGQTVANVILRAHRASVGGERARNSTMYQYT